MCYIVQKLHYSNCTLIHISIALSEIHQKSIKERVKAINFKVKSFNKEVKVETESGAYCMTASTIIHISL